MLNNCKDCSPRLFLLEYTSTAEASDDQLSTKFFFALDIWTSLSLLMQERDARRVLTASENIVVGFSTYPF